MLRCRHERARTYINEAVACYRAGAFRAAIVSTWVAVVYDVLDKLQELELAGDARARATLQEFERYQAGHNLERLLDSERHIRTLARDEFELLSAFIRTLSDFGRTVTAARIRR